MKQFKISPNLDKNKVFIVNRSEIEERLDPFYYLPERVSLEKIITTKTPKKLRDYVVSMSSGATPKTTEEEKYYSDSENGVPFIRVQNLSQTGILDFSDCKYINQETHNSSLKRSQIKSGDLLIKITGVGRMAVASVVPENFEGNINQHIVVIRTGSKEISEVLAAFLNSDIGEKLASRRSTGGTRPALDYPALLSIPIIYDMRLLEIANRIVKVKKQNEAEAEKLLASIDDYLLGELGIKLPPQPENNLKNRIFYTSFKEISSGRFDSFFYQEKFANNIEEIKKSKYPVMPLKQIIINNLVKGILPKHEEKDGLNKVVQINSINVDGTINLDDLLTAKDVFNNNHLLKKNDVLVVITGATIGKVAYWTGRDENYFLGGDIVKLQTAKDVDSAYVFHFLRSYPIQTQIKRNITGATNGHLSPEDIKNLPIPLPPLPKQQEIANHITQIRNQAQLLKEQANIAIKQANQEIEQILLG